MEIQVKSKTANNVLNQFPAAISAIEAIIGGWTARLDLKGIKVYKVKDIIRIDIKIEKEDLK